MTDNIVSVGLITPAIGILPDRIKFLLCLANPTEIWLLGMVYSDVVNNHENSSSTGRILQVMPSPLYCLSSDDFCVSCIEGTQNGRIFMGTREGYLLEMTYSPIPNWNVDSSHYSPLPSLPIDQTGSCSLINHSMSTLGMLLPSMSTLGTLLPSMLNFRFCSSDAIVQLVPDFSRSLIYVRTEDSNISVYEYYDTSLKSNKFSRLAYLSRSDLAYNASKVVHSVARAQFSKIITLCPIVTGMCYLMAVTATGIRLYFGENLKLLHIRLPPTSPHNTVGLSEVKLAVESRGTVVLISSLTNSGDYQMPPCETNAVDSNQNADTPEEDSSVKSSNPLPTASEASSVVNSEEQPDDEGSTTLPPHVIYTISPDLYPWTPNLTESFTSAWCVDGAWTLVILPETGGFRMTDDGWDSSQILRSNTSTKDQSDLSNAKEKSIRGQPPVVLTQHLDPPYRRLLLISAQGVVHFRLPNPLTKLREYLVNDFATDLVHHSATLFDPNQSSVIGFGSSTQQVDGGGDRTCSIPAAFVNEFLSGFLYQFSPDESIASALTIGAASKFGGNLSDKLLFSVDQAVLYFAAQASQQWTPSIVRPRLSNYQISAGQLMFSGSTIQSDSNVGDKTTTSALFLFSGLCVFLARIARSFWRSPMFNDATEAYARCASMYADCNATGAYYSVEMSRLKSWVKRFIYQLATASPLGLGKKQSEEPDLIIICRIDTAEINWILNQLTYLHQFLKRQLNPRGGWLHLAATVNPTTTTTSVGGQDQLADAHMEKVLLQQLAQELDQFLSIVIEVLGFWKILSEHPVHNIMRRLSVDHRNLILNLPIEVYVTSLLNIPTSADSNPCSNPATTTDPTGTPSQSPLISAKSQVGTELIGLLINALIEYYLREVSEQEDDELEDKRLAIGVENIVHRLQSTCPTLFANEDAMCAKASECLTQASVLRANHIATLDSQQLNSKPRDYISALYSQIDTLISNAISLYIDAGPGIHLENAVKRLETCGAWLSAVKLCLAVAQSRDPSNVAVDCLKHGRRPSSGVPTDRNLVGAYRGQRGQHSISELQITEARYDAYRRLMVCLEHLLVGAYLPRNATVIIDHTLLSAVSTSNNDCIYTQWPTLHDKKSTHMNDFILFRRILQTAVNEIVKTDDILAHFEIFGWLLSHGLTDTTISLKSPNLEAYLRSRLRQLPDNPRLRCLLWRQLELRGARLEAAQVLEHLAVTPCPQLGLEDRLDFAARAIVAVKALPTAQQDLDYLRNLEARLELAQLQQQLFGELSQHINQLRRMHAVTSASSPPQLVDLNQLEQRHQQQEHQQQLETALNQLTHGPLLSLTQMFTDYADRFGLHECKLHLLWTSGSQDLALIKATWRDLLKRTVDPLTIITYDSSATNISPRNPNASPTGVYQTNTPQPMKTPITRLLASPYRTPRLTLNRAGNQHLVELALVDCLSRLGNRFLFCHNNNSSLKNSAADVHYSVQGSIYFPFDEIISFLECYAIQSNYQPSWVPNLLGNARLTSCITLIAQTYDELLHSQNTFWRKADVIDRMYSVFIIIINDFLVSIQKSTTPRSDTVHHHHQLMNTTTVGRQKKFQINRLINQITGLLVDLNSDAFGRPLNNQHTSAVLGAKKHSKWVEPLRRLHGQLQCTV